ncbi:MAG: tRNA dihydrouridine(20/20a) synthase DusA [Pseudomonadota bacterium]|nr:tRNA dihydrouridine(20/20a) synthase DusA [Pseudomonadota bacterium]
MKDKIIDRRFCIAPMLDWTDSYCRGFHRLLTQNAVLYTEMVTTGALIFGDVDRHLRYQATEHPLALQLGGSDPHHLAQCAKLAEDYGYDEVNLNVGCPSDRVQSGLFGACLMADPQRVADCTQAMAETVAIPVTVKCRIGIDQQDDYEDLQRFVSTVAASGVQTFIVHARKAWLQGLSPKENRDIPPLNYERVYLLKKEFPELEIIINGGITHLDQVEQHLTQVDGVMMGRAAYQSPYLLKQVDQRIFGSDRAIASDAELMEKLYHFAEQHMQSGAQLKYLTRHIVGLFQNRPGARQWRRYLSENAYRQGAGVEVIRAAAAFIPDLSYDTDIIDQTISNTRQ